MYKKPLKEWTLNDCDNMEYWKALFQMVPLILLCLKKEMSKIELENHSIVKNNLGGNFEIFNKMLIDMINAGYLSGGNTNTGIVEFINPIFQYLSEEHKIICAIKTMIKEEIKSSANQGTTLQPQNGSHQPTL